MDIDFMMVKYESLDIHTSTNISLLQWLNLCATIGIKS